MYHMSTHRGITRILAASLTLSGLILPSMTSAQGTVEEIVVTAQFREENIQDVPLSISALSGDSLESKNATSVLDIEKWTPNLQIDQLGSGWGPTMAVNARGMGLNDFKAVFEPAVPIYVDDVLLGRPTAGNLDLLDLERVEVLRGPQGTLFGSNAAGGVIRLITRKPTGDGPTVLEATMGSYNTFNTRGSFETALGENLFGRFSFSTKRRDGYVDVLDFTCEMIRRGTPQLAGIGDGLGADGPDAGTAPDVVVAGSSEDNAFGIPIQTSPNGTNEGCKVDEMGDEGIISGRVQVRWAVSDSLEFNLAGDMMDMDQKSPQDHVADTADQASNGGFGLVNSSNNLVNIPNFGVRYDDRFAPSDPFVNYSSFVDPGITFGILDQAGNATGQKMRYPGGILTPNTMQARHWGVSGAMDWAINETLNARVILAYREFDSYFGRDSDGSPIPLNHTVDTYNDEQFTVEGRLSGQLALGYGSSSWTTDWTAGIFWYDASDYNSNISLLHMGVIGAGDIDRIDDQTNQKLGIFLHTITELTDQWTLTAGVRYTSDEKDILQTRIKRILENRAYVPADYLFLPTPLSQDAERVTPMASLSYQWNDDIMTYFTYQQGFRGGGFNPRPANLLTIGTFNPEEVENFELGIKSDWLDQRLRVNANLFYMDYTDLQLPAVVLDPLSGVPTFPTKNAGEADMLGIEMDFVAYPTEHISIDGTFGWLGFSYVDLGSADPAVIASFPGGGGTAIANPCLDCRPLRSPEISASLGAAFTTPISGGEWGNLTLRGDVSYQSETNFTANNFTRANQSAYSVFNARATWVSPTEDWELSVSGANLTDKLYKTSVLDFMDSLGGIQYGYGLPRMVFGSIKKRF